MKNFRTFGILLLIVALVFSFAVFAIAQDKKVTKKETTKTESVKKAGCCDKAVKADCPHSKNSKVLIKKAKAAVGVKGESDCQKTCASKCSDAKAKAECEKKCAAAKKTGDKK